MDKEVVLKKIFDFIAYKQASRKEIVQKLNKYADDQVLVEEVLAELEDMKLIDDEKYSHDFVFSCINSSKPRSRFQIEQYLYKKGISDNQTQQAIVAWTDDMEIENAKKIINSKRFEKNKMIKYLSSKGFRYDLALSLIDIEAEVK